MKYLTVDLEDWFHILDNPLTSNPKTWKNFESRIDIGSNIILDLFSKNNVKATFFCLGWVADKYPYLIKEINNRGHHIGSHGYYHQLVYKQNINQFRNDLKKSINSISNLTGKKVESYRAPGFSITNDNLWAFDVMIEEGIKLDSSIFAARRNHGGFYSKKINHPFILKTNSGNEIIELPIVPSSFLFKRIIYSGGGYFRLLPKVLLNHLFKKENYIMTYFHPRDFDENQPIIPGLNFKRRFQANVGISSTLTKLQNIINENSFDDINLIRKDIINNYLSLSEINK